MIYIQEQQSYIAMGAVLLASFLGSVHCIGMCGPMVLLVAPDWKRKILYNLGRLYAYVGVSLAFAFLGQKIFSFKNLELLQKIVAGIFSFGLIFLGVKLLVKNKIHLFKVLEKLQSKLLKIHFSVNSPASSFLVGLTSVLLPCGWLYSFLLISVLVGKPILAVGIATVFWLGTLPSMLFSPQILQNILKPIVHRAPKISGVLLILVGIFMLTQKLQSPHIGSGLEVSAEDHESCH